VPAGGEAPAELAVPAGGVAPADELVVPAGGEPTDLRVYNVGPVHAIVTVCATSLRSFDGHELPTNRVKLEPESLWLAAADSRTLKVSVDPKGASPGEYYGHIQVVHEDDPKTASRISMRVIVTE
jgi:hypothetical protein